MAAPTTAPPAPLRPREQDLADKVAVVTGGSRGIGRAIVLNLQSRGCCVLATCSSTESVHLIDSLTHSIEDIYKNSTHAKPKLVGIAANLLDDQTPAIIANALQRHFIGHLDIFINNACFASAMGIGKLTDDHISDNLKANIEIPIKIVEELVKRQLFRPNSRIVSLSSVRARKGWSQQYVYADDQSFEC